MINRILARRLIVINLSSQKIMLALKLIEEMEQLEEQGLLMKNLKLTAAEQINFLIMRIQTRF